MLCALVSVVSLAAPASGSGRPTSAQSSDRPPVARIVLGSQTIQTAHLQSFCWVSPSGRAYLRRCVDSVWNFPGTAEAPYATSIDVGLGPAPKPLNLFAHAWAAVDQDGNPIGPRMTMQLALRKDHDGWRAALELPIPCRDYFIELTAHWTHTSGLLVDASWTIHLRGYAESNRRLDSPVSHAEIATTIC